VKLAPDLAPEALDEAVDVALAVGASGIGATHTTLQRPGRTASHPRSAEAGGLSGAPLGTLSTRAVSRIHARAQGRLPIVGVGGVMEPADAWAKIRAGACLVQAYTGFIYGGPGYVRGILRGLTQLMHRDGFSRVSDAVGVDVGRRMCA